jgi:ABC-type Fe3+-hydroxamate transport system substrate-binding protein
MKLFVTALLLSAASFACAQTAQTAPPDQGAIDAAKSAADAWLALVDAGQYKASWEQAAEPLRKAVSVAQWETAGRAARMPVGALQERTLASSTYTTTLPGVPPGRYVVLQYAARFADRANAVETVTPMLDADGKWRVSGYFLR